MSYVETIDLIANIEFEISENNDDLVQAFTIRACSASRNLDHRINLMPFALIQLSQYQQWSFWRIFKFKNSHLISVFFIFQSEQNLCTALVHTEVVYTSWPKFGRGNLFTW